MINAIRGMNDILPDEAAKWRLVEDTTRAIFSLYGFSELRPPVMERTELFLRGIGDDTDVVEKQMYTFIDKSGDSVTLRPEATACVLRAVIEHGLLNKDPIVKLYSIGPMFRYERPQKGRYRQFHQINAERLGEDGPLADAETLAMAYNLASSILGNDVLLMEVNSLGCKQCRPMFQGALQQFLASRQDNLCGDCKRQDEHKPATGIGLQGAHMQGGGAGCAFHRRTPLRRLPDPLRNSSDRAERIWRAAMRRTPGWSEALIITPGPPLR